MKSILSILLAASAGVVPLLAKETAPVAEPAPAPYVLKKRSSFAIASGARPPVWPIGWVKRERGASTIAAVPATPKFVLDATSFTVTSILLGPPAIAVINGRAYEEGQLVRIAAPRTAEVKTPAAAGPRIRVHRIADGQVWLQGEGQLVNVAMKRSELSERKIEEELLNSERDDDAPLPAVSAR